MIQLHHTSSPAEALRPLPTADLDEVRQAPGWWWLDVVDAEPGEVRSVGARVGLHAFDLDDVIHPTELPKLEERDDYLFIVAHTPAVDPHRLRTVEVDCFLGRNYLVTFRREDSPGFEAFGAVVGSEAVAGPDVLLAVLLDVFAARVDPLVLALDSEIDELEDLAIAGDPEVILRTQALRRDAIRLRQLLLPQRDVVRALSRHPSALVGPAALRKFDSTQDDYHRSVEGLDTARSLLASVLDTYRGTVAERLNEVMKVLTVFSAIVLPLGLMAGIYGMNFTNMPELEWRIGYFLLLGLMGVTALGLWLYFARRGFIGGPRIPRVDRVVGRGLAAFVHLTVAPAKGAINILTATLGSSPVDDPDGRGPASG